jgi:hypothetical protein
MILSTVHIAPANHPKIGLTGIAVLNLIALYALSLDARDQLRKR